MIRGSGLGSSVGGAGSSVGGSGSGVWVGGLVGGGLVGITGFVGVGNTGVDVGAAVGREVAVDVGRAVAVAAGRVAVAGGGPPTVGVEPPAVGAGAVVEGGLLVRPGPRSVGRGVRVAAVRVPGRRVAVAVAVAVPVGAVVSVITGSSAQRPGPVSPRLKAFNTRNRASPSARSSGVRRS